MSASTEEGMRAFPPVVYPSCVLSRRVCVCFVFSVCVRVRVPAETSLGARFFLSPTLVSIALSTDDCKKGRRDKVRRCLARDTYNVTKL